MKKIFFAWILLICNFLLHAQTSEVPWGSGTKSNPYEIANLENLYWLSQNRSIWTSNSYFIQTADIDASDTKNWDNGSGFTPIGNTLINSTLVCFEGKYNGKGHTISGLYVNRPENKAIGFFGCAQYSKIDSVKLRNITITGYMSVGGLIGVNFSTDTISDCSSSGNITGYDYTGGLIGNNKSSIVNNSYSSGKVTGHRFVGGFIGFNCSNSLISNCFNSSDVTSNYIQIGGLVGYNENSNITKSYNTGDVSGYIFVGGLIGVSTSALVTYNYNTGNIVNTNGGIGGLIGQNGPSSTLTNSYNTGEISLTDNGSGSITGGNYSTVTNCFWDTLSAKSNIGCGANESSFSATGLSTEEMKRSVNLSGLGSFTTIWKIDEGHTYPALRAISNNPPFAFTDTITGSFQNLLANDYDYETQQSNLIIQIDSATSLKTSTNYTNSLYLLTNGDSLDVYYRVGELLDTEDTIWGNRVKSILVLRQNAPTLTSKSFTAAEDIKEKFDLTGSDADGDRLFYTIVTNAVNGTTTIKRDSLIYLSDTNFYGDDSVQVKVTDGVQHDTAWVHITVSPVNDIPLTRDTLIDAATDKPRRIHLPAFDIDGTISSFVISKQPKNGTTQISNDTLIYTSGTSFVGKDTIVWYARDNEGANSDAGTIIITVTSSISIDLTVSSYTIATGDTCFDATNEITVSSVTVEASASVNFIAGYSVTFLPGFHAVEGSYVHARITEDGSFCDLVGGSPIVEQPAEKSLENQDAPENRTNAPEKKSVKVYPNPNNGQFTLEFSNIESGAMVGIYNMLGARVYQSMTINEANHKIILPGIKKGIYFIKVMDGKKQLTRKMVVD